MSPPWAADALTRNYMEFYQKIENPMSVSLCHRNSSMLFQSPANYKPLIALEPDGRQNVFIMFLIGVLGDFLLKHTCRRVIWWISKLKEIFRHSPK